MTVQFDEIPTSDQLQHSLRNEIGELIFGSFLISDVELLKRSLGLVAESLEVEFHIFVPLDRLFLLLPSEYVEGMYGYLFRFYRE